MPDNRQPGPQAPMGIGGGTISATGLGGAALGIGSSLLETGINFALDKERRRRDVKQQKQMMDYQQQKQLEMFEATGYAAQTRQMKEAGLNPGLMYGISGGGAQTVGAGLPGVNSQELKASQGMGIQTAMQLALLQAQKENIEADTQNKLADIPNKQAQTPNIQADTENKILQAVILKYGGKEAQDTYEKVTSPNRGIQAKTYQDELEARQGIAGTIYEMWVSGKLAEKSLNEIQQTALQNAKTEQEINNIKKQFELLDKQITGQQINNDINELERKLQQDTGLDKNSPGWMKILGRLFIKYFR